MIILNCCFNVIIPKFNAVYIYTGFFYTVFFLFWVFGIWGKESDVACYKVIDADFETMNFHISCTRSKDIVLKKIMG